MNYNIDFLQSCCFLTKLKPPSFFPLEGTVLHIYFISQPLCLLYTVAQLSPAIWTITAVSYSLIIALRCPIVCLGLNHKV